jgi:hypothetical protein
LASRSPGLPKLKVKKNYLNILIITLVLVLFIGYFIDGKKHNPSKSNDVPIVLSKLIPPQEDIASQTDAVPDSYQIANVPFQSQAPDANWDQLHDEACEEAVVTIADYYKSGQDLTTSAMETEIQKQVAWEMNYFGGHYDLTTAQTSDMAQKIYGLKLKEIKISSINDIKKEISQNHLVIVPTAGRLLGNPNFRSPGPIYHMIVISGYDKNKIITQDVGTRNGKNYVYSESILFNAIHDWNGTNNINDGQKVMLVLTN